MFKCLRGNLFDMMTSASYVIALCLYWSAALMGCWVLHTVWFSRLSPRLGRALTGMLSGLLLAPCYASADTNTLAPALITGVFNVLFAGGYEAAQGAFLMLGLSALIGLTAGVFVGRVSTSRPN